ncbi:MAG: phage virion morphogenesis protein [Chitinispirillia bacterium]|nr:phage virion morphogenesis protein [Chitinispirillia bacterium]MCL2268588.1 phage virion morphogenesis protein [Chitinispirillia bacterium]
MLKISVDAAPVLSRLKKLAAAGSDLSAPLSVCGEILLSSVEENFQRGGRYGSAGSWRGGGTRWADLADSTKAARAKRGKWPGRILDMSQGGLAASISKTVQGNAVTVGTNKRYGAIHQFGGQAGRGRKVTIPARPFLVVQDEDVEDMMDVLDRYIAKQ